MVREVKTPVDRNGRPILPIMFDRSPITVSEPPYHAEHGHKPSNELFSENRQETLRKYNPNSLEA